MTLKILISYALFALFFIGLAAAAPPNVDERLIIRGSSTRVPVEEYALLVNKVHITFGEVNDYWGGAHGPGQSEKILVELEPLESGGVYSIFFFRTENGVPIRVVKVSGGGLQPQELAHKLTSALFPHFDKLVRNMMGEASERQFGNPASFPACGAGNDEWVMAFVQSGSYIPLSKIGASHADWGMAVVNNAPIVRDRKKQHVCYAEAGSFGQFLIDSFSRGKMKEFYLRTDANSRPWMEVFGFSLNDLETRWLENVRQKSEGKQDVVSALLTYWKKDPQTACFEAQAQAKPFNFIKDK